MMDFSLNLNDRVEIAYDDGVYKSTVQDEQKDFFAINIPVFNGSFLILHNGDIVDICVFNFNKNINKIYGFKAELIERKSDKNGMLLYLMKRISEPKLVQRRNHVRANVMEKVEYVKDDCDIKNFESLDKQQGFIVDISAGGVRLKTKEKFKLNEKLVLGIKNKQLKNLVVKGLVVRIDEKVNDEFVYGVRFKDIDEKQEDTIFKFVFFVIKRQRKLL